MKGIFIYPTKIKNKNLSCSRTVVAQFKCCFHEIWILIGSSITYTNDIPRSSRFRYCDWKVGNISTATRPFFSESRSSLVVLHDHWLYLERYSEQPKVSTFLEQSQCIYHLHRSSFFLLRLHKTDPAIFHLAECLSVCMVLFSSSSSHLHLLVFFSSSSSFFFSTLHRLRHTYALFVQVSFFIAVFPFFFFLGVYSPFESLFCLNIDKNEKWFIIHIYITPINRYLSNISNFAFCQQQEKSLRLKFYRVLLMFFSPELTFSNRFSIYQLLLEIKCFLFSSIFNIFLSKIT